MARYYNKSNKTEAISGVHFDIPLGYPDDPDIELPAHIVELPDDHIFFQPRPDGKLLVYDTDNIPTGYEDIPPPTAEEQALQDAITALRDQGISNNSITAALFIKEATGSTVLIDQIETAISDVASTYNITMATLAENL